MRLIVSAIIEKEGKFLIVKQGQNQHHANLWALPGGKLRLNESIIDGLTREIKEETNLDISPKEISYAMIYEEDNVIIIFVTCNISSENVRVGSDVSDHKWVSLDELEQLPTRPMMKEVIAHFKESNLQ